MRLVLTRANFIRKITVRKIVSTTRELSLESRLKSIDEAAEWANDFAKNCGFDDEFIYAVDLAIRESVANAVKHGNKFDESKPVEVKMSVVSGQLEITVRDHGSGFAVAEIPDPTNPENLLKASGRGILFMNSFMDTIEWEEHEHGGMIVKMVKTRA